MKIALVLDDSIDRPDGVQQYVLPLAGFLTRAGHEVHVLCSTASAREDVTVHSLARNVGVTFNGNGLRIPLPASRYRIRALLAREKYDVIHVQTPHSPLFAARVVEEARAMLADRVRIVIVTSGTGASTAFGLAEEVIGDMLGGASRAA